MAILAKDGMVAWYTDPRGVIAGGALFYSTVSGTASGGNIEIHRLLNGDRDTFLLAGALEVDDHDNACILVASTGQLICFYGRHSDSITRYRISLAAAPNIGGFGKEFQIAPDVGKSVSYAHAFLLSDGNVYLFRRHNLDDANGRPHQMCVDTEAAILAGIATFPTKTNIFLTASQRPYAKYVQNGTDRIDCFTTNGHPGEITGASLYHMYMQLSGGVLKFFKSDGTEITDAKPLNVATKLTPIQTTTTNQNESWTWEIRIGADGKPRCLSSRYPTESASIQTDIEYWHHRWDGAAWINTRLSQNNRTLYSDQPFYVAGLCFDGNDTSIIYMSENAGSLVAEIRKYSFDETSAALALIGAITSGSICSNLRPFSPVGHGTNDALLWASGVYTAYTNYEMDVYVSGTVNDRLPVPASFEAETVALVARMAVAPSTIRKTVINRRIKRLKAAPFSGSNLWAKKALDYIFAAHDVQAMLLNWKGAAGDLTVQGSPTRTVDRGVRGTADGIGYLLGPAPNAIGTPFSQSDAHMMGWYSATAVAGSIIRRITSGPPIFLKTGLQGRGALLRLNTPAGFTTSNNSSPNDVYHVASRTAANVVVVYRDGGIAGSNADVSGALDSAALAFAFQSSDNYVRGASMGSGLTQNEVADLFFIDWEYYRDLAQG